MAFASCEPVPPGNPGPTPPEPLTHAWIVKHGELVETCGDFARYWLGECWYMGEEETVWVNEFEETIADPDEDSDPDFYERDDDE